MECVGFAGGGGMVLVTCSGLFIWVGLGSWVWGLQMCQKFFPCPV